ncbi:hypothetical protein FACS189497_10340 [Betaproteobacteria bacterium]|nr:hypothetical protein FACS189488_10220 [Betaproteobacteria bacterium]GHU30512.1 hypothetical protein FACS189497_10340 [Betaproteobacteria bacterium]
MLSPPFPIVGEGPGEKGFEDSIREKEVMKRNLLTLLDKEERKLAKLTEYLISETISEDEYNISKKQTKINIGRFRDKLDKLNNEKGESIEDMERVFNFLVQARTHFNH